MEKLILSSPNGEKFSVSVRDDGVLVTEQTIENENSFSMEDINKVINDDLFYDEITYEELRDEVSGTDYYIVRIPHKDKHGNIIKLRHGFANDTFNYKDENGEPGETGRDFSKRHNASFAANASIWNYKNWQLLGVQIKDGEILNDIDKDKEYSVGDKSGFTLGITDDNELKVYHYTVPARTILSEGCTNAFSAFYPMIIDGNEVDFGIYSNVDNASLNNPRNVIAQLENKDILFLVCDARDLNNVGMTYADVIRILKSLNVKIAYNLDGGGSAQAFVRCQRLNKPVDNWGKKERKVGDFIYVAKDENKYNQNIKSISSILSDLNKKMQDTQLKLYESTDLMGMFRKKAQSITNCNSISESGIYYGHSFAGAVNLPTNDKGWAIIHVQIGNSSAIQIAAPYHSTDGKLMTRRTLNGMNIWSAWREL